MHLFTERSVIEMKICALVLALVLIFPAWGEVAWKENDGLLKIQLEEILSIGSLDEDVLFQWVGIGTDKEANIYVTDTMDHTVKKFNSQGKLIARAGGRGQGPGEFQAPRLLAHTGDLVYVTDQTFPGLHVFDSNLRYVKSIHLNFPVSDIQGLPEGRAAVLSFLIGSRSELCFIDDRGRIENHFVLGRDKKNALMDSADFVIDGAGNIYVVYSFLDRVRKLTRQGKELWSKSLFNLKSVKKKKIRQWEVPVEMIYMDCAVDGKGWLYILGGYRAAHRARDVYVVDPEGELRTTFTLPDTTHCIHIDKEGFLFARANEGMTLKKYRLKHVPK